ncbi:DUF1707 SHOCT-like domain-containing protein [Nonomuraea sp. bgisy101]|uniref:DUF1707 SHOCT-like domain-containing protein n=1 Tax=Nonomuraea sp. bgisy101 TaxID=3413784 RepID=UPI003D716BA8
MTDRAQLRAGDSDRDRVAQILRLAVGDGRISTDELDERLDRTYAARTCGELDAVVADLPDLGDQGGHLEIPAALRLSTGWARSAKQVGHWVVPPRIELECGWGTVRVNFMRATCPHREVSVDVRCDSLFADIWIVVPRGWLVRAEEVTTGRSGHVHNKPPTPLAQDGVVLRMTGHVESGDVWIRYRRPPGANVTARA